MHEDTVGAGPVDAARFQGQGMSIADAHLDAAQPGGASAGFGDHGWVAVHAGNCAAGADCCGQRGQVGARAASNVQDCVAGSQVKGGEQRLLVAAADGADGDLVEVTDRVRLGGVAGWTVHGSI